MADLKKRGDLKRSLTNLKKSLDVYDENTITFAIIKVTREKLAKLETDLAAVHHTLLANAKDQGEEDTLCQYMEAEETRIFEMGALLHEYEEKLQIRNAANNPHNPPPHQPPKVDFHTPKMDMPTFSGDVQKWQSFRDLFNSMVHNNPTMGQAQKLQFLKTAVKGDAARLLENIQVTDANYQGALDALEKRYNNERVVVLALMQRLYEQPAIQQESATALRKLIETTEETLRSLGNMARDPTPWSDPLVYLLLQKIDPDTRRRWEMQLDDTKMPTYDQLMKFLNQQAIVFESMVPSKNKPKPPADNKPKGTDVKPAGAKAHLSSASDSSCLFCKDGQHYPYKCEEILKRSVPERQALAKERNVCYNCLRPGHSLNKCNSSNCRKCGRRHNTLLHNDSHGNPQEEKKEVQAHTSQQSDPASVLLATALVLVQDSGGVYQECRALLDSGAQTSFITSGCVKRLSLKRSPTNVSITGIGHTGINSGNSKASLHIKSLYASKTSLNVDAIILNQVTGDLPSVTCNDEDWDHLNNLKLADPSFQKPRRIDILLGADILSEILLDAIIRGSPNTPIAQSTTLGWIVFGRTASKPPTSQVHANLAQCELNSTLERFWQIEEVSEERKMTAEERACEEHFERTFTRNEDGSYTVEMPFKSDPKEALGDSRATAVRRFHQLERRLKANPKLKQQYDAFMQEFIDLGHIEEVPEDELEKPPGEAFYLPHHNVNKESSSTTSLRVVFDASAKTTSGVSLNDNLMVGPVLQEGLFSNVVRFRCYLIPYVADVEKMFRKVWLAIKHRDYLRILWRFDSSLPLKTYRSKTVLYGSASATYQATKTIQQLAKDIAERFPLAAAKIIRDFYVDDLLSGDKTKKLALLTQQQLIEGMKSGNFKLRKWSSSCEELLESLDPSMRETQLPLRIEEDDSIKTLGMMWTPAADTFTFDVQPFSRNLLSKRNILSDIAKVFDPLGLLSPVTITGKIFMQSLWKIEADWDKSIPELAAEEWKQYRTQLHELAGIRIPRFVLLPEGTTHELHGFSDASEKAYSAAVYVRAVSEDGTIACHLIAAKTKVAPLKQISLPRLELCGAVLLTRLMQSIEKALPIPVSEHRCWTDSTIVLDWISSPPQRWRTYIANRVTTIQDYLSPDHWHHISGTINPADAPSRGIPASELASNKLWWNGPPFLSQSDYADELSAHPSGLIQPAHEERKTAIHNAVIKNDVLIAYSSLPKLKRHTAIWLRFFQFLKNPKTQLPSGPISGEELENALMGWIFKIQRQEYATEIEALTSKQPISKKSSILSLAPFLDSKGFLRVGGRLRHSHLPYDRKHPLLLSPHNHLTKLIITRTHEQQFHAGNQLTLSTLQQRFWIPRGKNAVKSCIKKCIRCFRLGQHENSNQLMGDLPEARLVPVIPFHKTGVDYGGPYNLRVMKGRCNKTFKSYIALFVCFTTRAVHLELVSDLTSDAFIGCLRRFVSRRGRPSEMFSDNGSNFVGADRELKEFAAMITSTETMKMISKEFEDAPMKWTFNPPAAPHMGGMWEAGIKSAKFHLKRVMGNDTFTFEEMSTILTQVEACLNSRPICPNPTDPNELAALTPGHFLRGAPLNAIPDPDLSHLKENRLKRWQLVQQRTQHFWRRWSHEYLSRLQQRPKWLGKLRNLEVNDIVLLKDDSLPPLKWKLGKIMEVHPGPDNVVRVVTVKTADGIYKRPVNKVSLLPLDAPADPECPPLPSHSD